MDNIQKIRDAIASSTQQWINSISAQKLSQNNSENFAAQNYQQPTTSTNSENATFDNMIEKSTGSNSGVIPTFDFLVCINGEPKKARLYGSILNEEVL